jgi:hypothetical protein
MNLHVLDVVFWILGIRGHIPQHDSFRANGGESSLAGSSNQLLRILAAFLVSIAVLALALWAAVWLAIRLL